MIIMLIVALAGVLIIATSLRNGIGPMPSSRAVTDTVASMLPDDIQGDIVEMGAGWGGVSIMLARHYPRNRVLAIENNLPVWCLCWLRGKLMRVPNLEVRLDSIYKADLSHAGLIYCYLFPEAMQKIQSRLPEVKPGCVVISSTFALSGNTEEYSRQAQDLWRSPVYLYRLSQ